MSFVCFHWIRLFSESFQFNGRFGLRTGDVIEFYSRIILKFKKFNSLKYAASWSSLDCRRRPRIEFKEMPNWMAVSSPISPEWGTSFSKLFWIRTSDCLQQFPFSAFQIHFKFIPSIIPSVFQVHSSRWTEMCSSLILAICSPDSFANRFHHLANS